MEDGLGRWGDRRERGIGTREGVVDYERWKVEEAAGRSVHYNDLRRKKKVNKLEIQTLFIGGQ